MSNSKKPYCATRIGGIPTVVQRGDSMNCQDHQVSQVGTMGEARAEAARLNEYAELRDEEWRLTRR